jgi:hypothetical protein
MGTLHTKIALLATLALLALPATVLASPSSEGGYAGPNNVVSGIQGGGGGNAPTAGNAEPVSTEDGESTVPSSAVSSESSTLPFTGADLGILLASAAILFGAGIGLRRLTRHPSES